MDEAGQKQSAQPCLCTGGCGFFGSAETGNMCSKCWREELSRKRAETDSMSVSGSAVDEAEGSAGGEAIAAVDVDPVVENGGKSIAAVEIAPLVENSSDVPEEAAQTAPQIPAEAAAPPVESPAAIGREPKRAADVVVATPKKKKKHRCAVCDKKVGIAAIKCRCEQIFCAVHRYPECHNCTFDFKRAERAALAEAVTGGGQFERITKI